MKLIFPLWGAKHGSNESLSNETARCRRASCLAGQTGALESSCIRLSPPQPPTGQHGAVRHPVHRAGTAWPVPKREGLAWHGTAVPACGAGTAQHCAAQHPELQEHGSRPPASLFACSPRSPGPLLTYKTCLLLALRAHTGSVHLAVHADQTRQPTQRVPLSALHPLPLTVKALHSLPLMCYLKCISHNLPLVWDVISS